MTHARSNCRADKRTEVGSSIFLAGILGRATTSAFVPVCESDVERDAHWNGPSALGDLASPGPWALPKAGMEQALGPED